jgi:Zn-dependent oligopeptidase
MPLNELLTSFQELEKLTQKFSENVLDATKKFEKLITDKKEIEGLPATALGLAAQTAVSKVGTITNPKMLFPSFILYADKCVFC